MACTAVLLPGNMCDSRLWSDAVRSSVGSAVDADLTRDESILGMAERTLASVGGDLVPIGFSMGGIVALAMGRLAPSRIAGLVLLDTNPGADLPERSAVRPRQQQDVRAGALERVVVDELKPNYLAAVNRANRGLLTLLREMAMTLGPEVFVRQSEALRTRPDLRPVLATLKVPVFLACGAEDRLCPPAWHEAMAQAVTDPTLRIFPDAGHMLPLEQADALAAELAPWFENLHGRSHHAA